ncbi:hypothetical protein [Pseudomonas oryzihabitans]|uniref:hypothetical protein n=1 Tax=Pseudomonas oryzihabitans TaxID=47885 RepID=UPI0020945719|nr:hypothetical protein [Pseudomonas psychrotolerans]
MKIVVRPLRKSTTSAWQVCIDKQAITFLSEADARSYVATLEARIAAPIRCRCAKRPRQWPRRSRPAAP